LFIVIRDYLIILSKQHSLNSLLVQTPTINSMLVAPTLRRRELCVSINCCISRDVSRTSSALRRRAEMTSLST